jgi:hypothetical protein
VDGVGKVAARGQFFETRTPTRRGESQRHELEASFVVPAAEAPDGLATEAAAVVVQDCQWTRPVSEGLVRGHLARKRFGNHGAEW